MTATTRRRWVRIIDVAKHQAPVDFVKMKATGVDGVILRVSHGDQIDPQFAAFYPAAKAVFGDNVAGYTFINPKRCDAQTAARVWVQEVERIVGHTDFGFMLDCEWYAGQSPAGPELAPAGNATYIRGVRDGVRRLAPKARLFAYSSNSYWAGYVKDATLAGEFEWIVPRYPVYPPANVTDPARGGSPAKLDAWLASAPQVTGPAGWDAWAFLQAPDGPRPPAGGQWSGWQFSAGYNRQGHTYGVSSGDVDLNIVDADAWARWTGRTTTAPTPPVSKPVATPLPKPQPSDTLQPGATLLPGEARTSRNGSTVLIHQASDGNLVCYHKGRPVWSARINGQGVKRVTMQADGNLVAYGATTAIHPWDSRTHGHPGALLRVLDGRAVIVRNGRVLWATDGRLAL